MLSAERKERPREGQRRTDQWPLRDGVVGEENQLPPEKITRGAIAGKEKARLVAATFDLMVAVGITK